MADYMYPPMPPRHSRYNDYRRDDYQRTPRYHPEPVYRRPRSPSFKEERGFQEPRGRRRSHQEERAPEDYRPRQRALSHDTEPLHPPRRPRSPPRSQYQRPQYGRRQSSSLDAPRRRHHSPPPPRRSRSITDVLSNDKVQHATKAGVDAAAVEAIRLRRQPGQWAGQKGVRVATAAMGAVATDVIADKARDGDQSHSKRHLIESIIGGLLANRALNGSKKSQLHKR